MTAADYTRCIGLLGSCGAVTDDIHCLVIEGEPRSKARPRFSGNGHVYTPVKQRESEQVLKIALRRGIKAPMMGNVAVACLFYRSTFGRVDADNMLKHVMDAANGICWTDDYQVTAMVGITELDRGRPRTVIGFARHESTMIRSGVRTKKCKQCDREFPVAGRTKTRFCSIQCAGKAFSKIADPIPCGQCEQPFRRVTTTQRFCSKSCRARFMKGSPKGIAKIPVCRDCGTPVKRKASPRCRACWKLARATKADAA